MKPPDNLVDVIEVQIKAPHTIRVMATSKPVDMAEAFIRYAVLRRGCENQFYTTAPVRQYRDGDPMPQKPISDTP